ncbi:MAG: hypothetical protein HY529_06225 [Chloroflexi bacterium]|nr:hypothetical protein [Chloroflexota bacterium]
MKSFVRIARIALLLLFLVILSLALVACEPMLTIRVHNQTDETFQIFFFDKLIGKAASRGEVIFEQIGILPKYKIVAKDINGNIVYTANFTRRDVSGKKTYDVYFPPRSD